MNINCKHNKKQNKSALTKAFNATSKCLRVFTVFSVLEKKEMFFQFMSEIKETNYERHLRHPTSKVVAFRD